MNDKRHFPADGRDAAQVLPPWPECDLFCIHDYAGSGASPCGWRGRMADARCDAGGAKLLCPRCGSGTLLRIPLTDVPGNAR